MSPDPGNAGADPMNPQSWNAYAYVNNNPLNKTDSTGKYIGMDVAEGSGGGWGWGWGGWGDGWGSYYVDGAPTTASAFSHLVDMGAAVSCPGNICSGWATSSKGEAKYDQYVSYGDAPSLQGYETRSIVPPPGPNLSAISHTVNAVSPYLSMGSGNYQVQYQERGNTFNIQIINPATGAPFQFGDLHNLPATTTDPLSAFHSGNPSIYVGSSALDILHLANVIHPYGVVQAGIDAHNDRFNPVANPVSFVAHQLFETIPFFFNRSGISGGVTCSISQGCR
jgi:hypothetical protein